MPTLTHWLRKPATRTTLRLEAMEDRLTPTVSAFQNQLPLSVDGTAIMGSNYTGTQDAEIISSKAGADSNFGGAISVSIDQQDPTGVRQGLLRFDNIFGNQPGQVPLGSKINSAKIDFWEVSSTNTEAFNSFNRMLVPWTQDSVTWNSFPATSGGVQFDGVEAEQLPDGMLANDINHSATSDTLQQTPTVPITPGFKDVDVTPSLRAWASGVSNFGWLVHQFGENGWDWDTSEQGGAATVNGVTYSNRRPKLTIDYSAPNGAGSFAFLDSATPVQFAKQDISVVEGNSGQRQVTVRVIRQNGFTGQAKVNYALDAAPGMATNGSDYSFSAGQLTFEDGERIKTFSLSVSGDNAIEGPETIRLRLTNPTGGATIDTADNHDLSIVRIADNEVLLNEIVNDAVKGAYLNGTNTVAQQDVNDIGYEYVELLGNPNLGLGNVSIGGDTYNTFVIVVNGDTKDTSSTASANSKGSPIPTANGKLNTDQTGSLAAIGRIDTVFGLGGNALGSAGLLTIRSSDANFKYYTSSTNPAGNTDVVSTLLDADLNTSHSAGEGRFDNATNTWAIVLVPTSKTIAAGDDIDLDNDGIIDNLPAGAILLDSVGTNDIHRPSQDRILGEGWAGTRVIQANDYTGNLTRFNDLNVNDLAPNRIFSWYGGITKIDNLVYVDNNSTVNFGQTSFNTPAGAQLTAGRLNIPRAIGFDAAMLGVNEAAGTVTISVTRLGDSTVEAKVNFATSGDTAVSGVDFIATSGQLTFPIGNSVQTIVVPLTNDTLAEGFENFSVNLSSPTPSQFVIAQGTISVRITDDDSLTKNFQEEVDGYFGTKDTALYATSGLANDNFSSDLTVGVDQEAGSPDGPKQGVLRFDNLFGGNSNQVPAGSRIYGGQLTFNVADAADASTRIRFFRILQDWNAGKSTWTDPLGTGLANPPVKNGFTPDGVEANAFADFELNPASRIGQVTVDVPASVLQSWANGTPNYGWMLASNSGNGWEFESADAFLTESRPKLTLIYTEPGTLAGGFQFEQPVYTVAEGGTTASFTIYRIGGNTGDATVNYSLLPGTAAPGDYAASSGSFLFPDGGLTSQTFTVTLQEDNFSERNETFTLKLTNAIGAGIFNDAASVTIRDNDLDTSVRLSEILINPPQSDAPFEYVEISGAASTGLGNYYLVGMEGDNNVYRGNADVVFDLSGVNNGSNGYTIVKSDIGGHTPAAGATVVTSTLLNAANTNGFRTLQNETNTYLVIYSPNATLSSDVFDYDWDNDGTLELPAGAVIVDSIGITDNGIGSINYTTAVLTLPSATPDAATRIVGNSAANDKTAWYYGELFNSAGNASLGYDTATAGNTSTNTPPSALLTPGAQNYVVGVTGIVVNNGAVQRSRVTTVTVNFNAPVTAAQFTGVGAIQFVRPGGLIQTGAVGPNGLINVAQGTGTSLVLTFSNANGAANIDGQVQSGSLSDGRYNLTIPLAGYTSPQITRLFGDLNGDATIDGATDFASLTFGDVNANNGVFDFNNDGTIDGPTDFAEFGARFGKSV